MWRSPGTRGPGSRLPSNPPFVFPPGIRPVVFMGSRSRPFKSEEWCLQDTAWKLRSGGGVPEETKEGV
jgi:hypothetical protein